MRDREKVGEKSGKDEADESTQIMATIITYKIKISEKNVYSMLIL